MSLVEMRRELTRRSIDQNPSQVAFTRVGKIPDGAGGWIEDEVTLAPQTVRLFMSSNRGSRDVSQVGGQMQINQAGLLALHNADIRKDDAFEQDGLRYKVAKVDPVRLQGEVVSIQCDLEEVV